jgi:SAM-dependent methyltransferase
MAMGSTVAPTRARTAQRSAASVANGLRGWLVGASVRLARALDRAVSASTFAAAGLLSFDGLQRHMAEDWRYFGDHQPETDVAGGLFSWEQDFYAPHLKRTDRILVVGCGTGRDLLALLDLGFRGEGLEPVAELAQQARERLARRGLTAAVYTADIVTATLPDRVDVFILSWYCYSYIPQRSRRIAVLGKLRDRLAPEGRILISYILADPPPRRALWRLATLAARLSRSDWRPEYGDVFVARHEIGRIHFEHRFTPAEIEAEAHAAGLRVAVHAQAADGSLALVA